MFASALEVATYACRGRVRRATSGNAVTGPCGLLEATRRGLRRLLLALAAAWVLTAPSAFAVELVRTDVGSAVLPDRLLDTLSQSGVLARLSAGETLRLLDAEITAAEDTVVYLSLSSEFRIAALLSGRAAVANSGDALAVGKVAVWPIGPGAPRVSTFDIDRFLASSSLALAPETRARLAAAASAQREEIYWGVLRRSGSNPQAPLPPLLEAVRRDMLLRPVVITLRHAAEGDTETLAQLAAERFLEGMRTGDVATVRDLMAPSLFEPDDRTPTGWLTVRNDMAHALIASPLGRALARADLADSAPEDGFIARTPEGRQFRIAMREEHGMAFIGEITPETGS